jgi:FAD:protein FMN transferase
MRTELNQGAIQSPPVIALERHVINGPTMGTRISAVFYAPADSDQFKLSRDLRAAVDAVDTQMSTWKPESDLMRLNRAATGIWHDVPPQLGMVIAAALEIGRLSEGAFDIGVGDLVSAWGFGSSPARETPRRPIANADPRRPAHLCLELDTERRRVRKLAPVTLDLSGIAKGFGVDELARVLHAHGIGHFLVSIDGELRAAGGKPDGTPWRVAVEKPNIGSREAEGILELTDGAVATSGDYRHFVDIEGVRFGHTIDPRSQEPLVDGPAAVTVLAETCMAADAWATALLILGPTAGGAIAATQALAVLFIERPQDLVLDTARLPRSTKEN